MLDGEFEPQHFDEVRDTVTRTGVTDVRAFGLTWEDCEHLLKQLGYSPKSTSLRPDSGFFLV